MCMILLLKSFGAPSRLQQPFNSDRSDWLNRKSSRATADVVLQLLDDEFPVADDALDQITNRNNAEQRAIFSYRQMAHALRGHERHAFLDCLVGPNAYDVAFH